MPRAAILAGRPNSRRAADTGWCRTVPGHPSKHGANVAVHRSRPPWSNAAEAWRGEAMAHRRQRYRCLARRTMSDATGGRWKRPTRSVIPARQPVVSGVRYRRPGSAPTRSPAWASAWRRSCRSRSPLVLAESAPDAKGSTVIQGPVQATRLHLARASDPFGQVGRLKCRARRAFGKNSSGSMCRQAARVRQSFCLPMSALLFCSNCSVHGESSSAASTAPRSVRRLTS